MARFNFPELARARKRESNTVAQYTFPRDIGQHYMHITFEKYNFGVRKNNVNAPKNITRDIMDSIALPLPENLLDNSQVKVGATELGLGGALAANSIDKLAPVIKALSGASNVDEAKEALGISSNVIKDAGNVAAASLIRQGLQAIAPGLQKGLEVGSGFAFNPYQALAFDGVDLKTHVFDWTLAPETRDETETLRNVIRTIRKHIHPRYADFSRTASDITGKSIGQTGQGRAFLQYPDIINVTLMGSPKYDVPVYKPGMVSQFQVNFTGGGENAFLEGGSPAVVKISMTMTEMEIWTRQDYDGTNAPQDSVETAQDLGGFETGIV